MDEDDGFRSRKTKEYSSIVMFSLDFFPSKTPLKVALRDLSQNVQSENIVFEEIYFSSNFISFNFVSFIEKVCSHAQRIPGLTLTFGKLRWN